MQRSEIARNIRPGVAQWKKELRHGESLRDRDIAFALFLRPEKLGNFLGGHGNVLSLSLSFWEERRQNGASPTARTGIDNYVRVILIILHVYVYVHVYIRKRAICGDNYACA